MPTAATAGAVRGRSGGADYYLAKPFTADEVLYLIDGVLGDSTPDRRRWGGRGLRPRPRLLGIDLTRACGHSCG
jgi:DNA-binding response OmpR family regulator